MITFERNGTHILIPVSDSIPLPTVFLEAGETVRNSATDGPQRGLITNPFNSINYDLRKFEFPQSIKMKP